MAWSAGSMIFSRLLNRWPEDFDDQDELALFGLNTVTAATPLFDWFFIGHLGADWTSTRRRVGRALPDQDKLSG
ncbi:hypothetical protein ACFDTO_07150 [Microbacteriaceae bacterium 4G12]